ncbi:MAG: DnaJ domain-containing protein [Candidatus Babeliaceae bacterium]|nr:DnaJ domain-containing protein [Candidatus Babeliaceae bacterium]
MDKKTDHTTIEHALTVLGLTKGATPREIKKVYYQMAKEYHPDMCAGKRKKRCEERFKEISHAYKVLHAYCVAYGPQFDRKSIKKNMMGDEYYDHLKRFYDGWWGNLDL